jgi:hypothetical protein
MGSNKLDSFFAHYQQLKQTAISLQTYKNRSDIDLRDKVKIKIKYYFKNFFYFNTSKIRH